MANCPNKNNRRGWEKPDLNKGNGENNNKGAEGNTEGGVRVETNEEGEGVEKSKEGRVEEITRTVGEGEVETNIEGGQIRGVDKGEGLNRREGGVEDRNYVREEDIRSGNGTTEGEREITVINFEEGAMGGGETQVPIPTQNSFSLLQIDEEDGDEEDDDEVTNDLDSECDTPNLIQTNIKITKREKKTKEKRKKKEKRGRGKTLRRNRKDGQTQKLGRSGRSGKRYSKITTST